MAKPAVTEVEVLRFFENESLDRTTILFNIVSDKMHTRLHRDHEEPPLFGASPRRTRSGKSPGADQPASHAADRNGSVDRTE
jgi:hypothetical protein